MVWKGSKSTRNELASVDATNLEDSQVFLVPEAPAWYYLDSTATDTVDGDNFLNAIPAGRWIKIENGSGGGGGGGGPSIIQLSSTDPVTGNVSASAAGELYYERVVASGQLDTADVQAELTYFTVWRATAPGVNWEAIDGSNVSIVVTLDNNGDVFNLSSEESTILGFNAQFDNQTVYIFDNTGGYGGPSIVINYMARLSFTNQWFSF